jgi:hypothetical protein
MDPEDAGRVEAIAQAFSRSAPASRRHYWLISSVSEIHRGLSSMAALTATGAAQHE